jgi:hypothetical protein
MTTTGAAESSQHDMAGHCFFQSPVKINENGNENVHSSTQSSLAPPSLSCWWTRSTHSSKWCFAGAHWAEFLHSEMEKQLASRYMSGRYSRMTLGAKVRVETNLPRESPWGQRFPPHPPLLPLPPPHPPPQPAPQRAPPRWQRRRMTPQEWLRQRRSCPRPWSRTRCSAPPANVY